MKENLRFVADNYLGGEFSHIDNAAESKQVGDSLFVFLIAESMDADDLEDLHDKIGAAIDSMLDLNTELLKRICFQ